MKAYEKLAFVGDVGSGKSTIIRTLSEISAVDTDRRSTVDIGKEFTTIGIDYGRISLGDDLALGLYGVPGQKRYSMLWDHVNQSLWGIAFMVRSSAEPSIENLDAVISHFDPAASETPFVVAISHADISPADQLEHEVDVYSDYLKACSLPGTVMTVDCTSFESSRNIPLLVNSIHYQRLRLGQSDDKGNE